MVFGAGTEKEVADYVADSLVHAFLEANGRRMGFNPQIKREAEGRAVLQYLSDEKSTVHSYFPEALQANRDNIARASELFPKPESIKPIMDLMNSYCGLASHNGHDKKTK